MPSRTALKAVLLVLAMLLPSCTNREPKSIVMIVVDTLRRDYLSPYGSSLATPNVAALAERGQVFTNAVASFHQTTMSTAALFTGRTPSLETGARKKALPWTGRTWCGLSRFAVPQGDTCVPQGLTTLAEEFHNAGYWTAAVVSNRLLFKPSGYDQGFDAWVEVGASASRVMLLPPLERAASRSAPRVQSAVREVLAERPSNRFFLYVHYMDVHDWGLVSDDYAEAVKHFDGELGRLLQYLQAEGLLDDAVVIFTSDHGEALGEEHPLPSTRTHLGNPSFEPVLEIPLIVAPAARADPSRLIRSQDIGGLAKQIAGLAAGEPRDLEPEEVFLAEERWQTYRKGRFKSMFQRNPFRVGLFDIEADPGETVNLLKERPAIALEHLKRVFELTHELAGQVAEDEVQTEQDRERLRALGYLQ